MLWVLSSFWHCWWLKFLLDILWHFAHEISPRWNHNKITSTTPVVVAFVWAHHLDRFVLNELSHKISPLYEWYRIKTYRFHNCAQMELQSFLRHNIWIDLNFKSVLNICVQLNRSHFAIACANLNHLGKLCIHKGSSTQWHYCF